MGSRRYGDVLALLADNGLPASFTQTGEAAGRSAGTRGRAPRALAQARCDPEPCLPTRAAAGDAGAEVSTCLRWYGWTRLS